MNKIYALIILVVISIGDSFAFEANWELYAETDKGIKYYFDRRTAVEDEGMKQILTMQDHSTQGTSLKSVSFLFKVDCKDLRAKTVGVFGFKDLMGKGERIDLSGYKEWDWMNKVSGTPNGELINLMCGG
tara:strand:+ start:92 stop:481 length:390 start_codon:yes stop_codon:yes gene_type:complete